MLSASDEGQNQLFYTHAIRASFPTPLVRSDHLSQVSGVGAVISFSGHWGQLSCND